MITQKTQEATYSYKTIGRIRATDHAGRTEVGKLVQVDKSTGARYLVTVTGTQAFCTCPQWQFRCKDEPNSAGCKHVSGTLGHLLREAEATPAPAAVSPTIIGQIEDPHAEARRDAERLW